MISSLTHWSFKSMLFNFDKFMNFPIFILFLISSFIPLWLIKIFGMILNLLRLVLLPNICSVLENVLCTFEKKVYLLFWGEVFYLCLLALVGSVLLFHFYYFFQYIFNFSNSIFYFLLLFCSFLFVVVFCFFFLLHCTAYRVLVLRPGVWPELLWWKHQV